MLSNFIREIIKGNKKQEKRYNELPSTHLPAVAIIKVLPFFQLPYPNTLTCTREDTVIHRCNLGTQPATLPGGHSVAGWVGMWGHRSLGGTLGIPRADIRV